MSQRISYADVHLKRVGVDICNLPTELAILMDHYVAMQKSSNIISLDLKSLKFLYYKKYSEGMQLEFNVWPTRTSIKRSEIKISQNTEECELLEKFIKRYKMKTHLETQQEKLHLKNLMDTLKQKQEEFKPSEDFKLSQIMQKIHILEENEINLIRNSK